MVTADLIVTQIINGLSFGFSIALVAIGLSLVFGSMDIVNFAHGEFFMMGGYGLFFLLPILAGLPLIGESWALVYVTAMIIAAAIVALIAIVIEKLTLEPLQGRDPLQSLIVTFGLVLILQQIAFELFGGGIKQVRPMVSGSVSLAGISYPSNRLIAILGALLLLGGVYWILVKTRFGIQIRAAAQDRETARSLGVQADRVFMAAFGLSAILAVFAAAFLVPLRSLYPTVGATVILDAFIVVIIGGLGSITGAVVAALLIGLMQSLTVLFLPPFASQIASFALLIVVLLVRPQGLMGGREA